MRKTNGMMTRLLACVLLLATAVVSLASCEVKDKADEAWETVKDGATDLYEEVKEKISGSIVIEPLSGNEHISLCAITTASETVDPTTYSETLSASSFVGASGGMNEMGSVYVTLDRIVGKIVSVRNGIEGDYMTLCAEEQPIVDIDEATSKLCVILPDGCNTVEEWIASENSASFVVQVSNVIQKGLEATVESSYTLNKNVRWAVSSAESDVEASEYLRLVVDPADSKKISVLALAPFGGHEFTITCTTVVGGYTATCKVTYEGLPTYIGLYNDGSDTLVTDEDDVITMIVDNSTIQTFEILLGNAFGDVDDQFNHFVVGSCSWEGSYTLREGSFSGGQWGYGVEERTCDAITYSEFLTRQCINSVFYENGNLCLSLKKSIRSYDVTDDDNQRTKWVSGDPILCITVKETLSGVKQTFRFKFVLSEVSVALSDTTLTF